VTLKDLRGQEVRLSDHRGKVVLINFWATWCKPCETEMPVLQASFQKLRHGRFVILAINTLDSSSLAAEHIRSRGYTFPVLFDQREEAANRFRVRRLPTSFLIDRKGIVREQILGSLLTEERIAELAKIYGNGDPSTRH
jgi:thiol-disulfide isomerase/thioredoxin